MRLVRYDGTWPADDPDANFRADVAAYSRADPLATIERLAGTLDLPVGAVVRYVLAKWATGGSEALLELGPSTVQRMRDVVAEAEAAGTDEARLARLRAARGHGRVARARPRRPGGHLPERRRRREATLS